MRPIETDVGMHRFARGWSVKRFEWSNRLDTALYKNLQHTLYFQDAASRHPVSQRCHTTEARPGYVVHRFQPVSRHETEGGKAVRCGRTTRLRTVLRGQSAQQSKSLINQPSLLSQIFWRVYHTFPCSYFFFSDFLNCIFIIISTFSYLFSQASFTQPFSMPISHFHTLELVWRLSYNALLLWV